jgi:hypothetical protein
MISINFMGSHLYLFLYPGYPGHLCYFICASVISVVNYFNYLCCAIFQTYSILLPPTQEIQVCNNRLQNVPDC